MKELKLRGLPKRKFPKKEVIHPISEGEHIRTLMFDHLKIGNS